MKSRSIILWEVFGAERLNPTRCTRPFSKVRQMFMLNSGTTPFTEPKMCFGPWDESAARTTMGCCKRRKYPHDPNLSKVRGSLAPDAPPRDQLRTSLRTPHEQTSRPINQSGN